MNLIVRYYFGQNIKNTYISNNNAKVSLDIDVEKIQSDNNINTNVNYIKKILKRIDSDGLSDNMYEISIKVQTVDGFMSIHDALVSTTDFKSSIQSVDLLINASNMVSPKISNLFFDELDININDRETNKNNTNSNPTANTSSILLLNLKYLRIYHWWDCGMDCVLDLFGLIRYYAKVSDYKHKIWLNYCIFGGLISINSDNISITKSKIDGLFNLLYEIMILIKYPVNTLLKMEFDMCFGDNVSEEMAINEMQKQCECFENKLKSDYQQPICKGLQCQPLKQPNINISINCKDQKFSIDVETTDWPENLI